MKPITQKTRTVISICNIAALLIALVLQLVGHAKLALLIEGIVVAIFVGLIFVPKEKKRLAPKPMR
jgi:hypothetical protein